MKPLAADMIELCGWAMLAAGLWWYDPRVALAGVGGVIVLVALIRRRSIK